MVRIIWTELALDDLKNIHDYVSRESRVYAIRLVDKIIGRVQQLEIFPESGKIVPEFGEKSIKELIEGNYLIIYKIHSEYIGISRIHHSARLLYRI